MVAFKLFLSTPPSRVATVDAGMNVVESIVSIHATLAGGDHVHFEVRATATGVSIHATLAGGDRQAALNVQSLYMFLSTPPSRVATVLPCAVLRYIHRFYPRHPRGWRQTACIYHAHLLHVSIHATLAGGDCVLIPMYLYFPVSIHATLAGGDRSW